MRMVVWVHCYRANTKPHTSAHSHISSNHKSLKLKSSIPWWLLFFTSQNFLNGQIMCHSKLGAIWIMWCTFHIPEGHHWLYPWYISISLFFGDWDYSSWTVWNVIHVFLIPFMGVSVFPHSGLVVIMAQLDDSHSINQLISNFFLSIFLQWMQSLLWGVSQWWMESEEASPRVGIENPYPFLYSLCDVGWIKWVPSMQDCPL